MIFSALCEFFSCSSSADTHAMLLEVVVVVTRALDADMTNVAAALISSQTSLQNHSPARERWRIEGKTSLVGRALVLLKNASPNWELRCEPSLRGSAPKLAAQRFTSAIG